MTTSVPFWRATALRFTPTERQRLFGLTIAIGGVCGLAAVAFHLGIRAVEHQAIDRAFAGPGGTWIGWVLLVPTAGALAAGLVLHYWAPGARGSGIPQVKVAYTIGGGRMRLRDALAKFVLGSVQIGTGSSLGREGPTVQICAGLASWMGRVSGISAQNLRLLLPVGAAAGIAAAFNAPLAAVTFTIEEIIGTLDPTMLSGVVVAAAFAAVVEHGVLGAHPVFSIPSGYGLDHASSLLFYAALGLAAALVSIVFSSALLGVRRWFATAGRLPGWAKPAVGGLAAGAIAVVAMLLVRHRGIDGGGYVVLGEALSGSVAVRVLAILGILKLLATACSYGSGGAGGLFAPSLFLGGMLGGLFGVLDVAAFGHSERELGAFALVGMGAVFAGTVRAPITSILIIVEMTGGYALALPLMIANVTAYAVARHYRPVPIYDALLRQDGVDLHRVTAADPLDAVPVPMVTDEREEVVSFAPGDGVGRLLDAAADAGRQEVFPVIDGSGRLVGIVTLADLTTLSTEPELGDLVRAADLMRSPVSLAPGEPASRALVLMHETGLRQLPVVGADGAVVGLLDEAIIAHAYLQARRTGGARGLAPDPAANEA